MNVNELGKVGNPMMVTDEWLRRVEEDQRRSASCGICGIATHLDLALYGNAYASLTLGPICARCATGDHLDN